MKKVIAIVLALALVFSFAACSKTATPSNDDGEATGKQIKIGVLQFGEFDALQNAYKGFVDGLEEAGYKDGDKIKINYQSAAADTGNCPTIADSLINDGSDLILAIATPSILSLKEKTSKIPLLFTAVTDPVSSDIVASNDAPGANITGTSDMNPVAEQINLLTKIVPAAKTVAVMYCSSESNSAAQYELAKVQIEAAGLTCVKQTVSAIDEAKSAVESLKGKADALYIPTDNTLADGMNVVSAAAIEAGIPIIAGEGGMVKSGALATYGIDYYELGKQTAQMAVEILEGASPSTMPVGFQTSTDVLEIAVNTETATALGITFPADVLEGATQYPEA